ncbi:MAG: ferritin-like domain-containing protein [Telmatospirillum sp.]|nr:ferritin-like domain-containing protein [Telmatospirillum sp.]
MSGPLHEAALAVLAAAAPAEKIRLTAAAADAWRRGDLVPGPTGRPETPPPAHPARPAAPGTMAPKFMPRRRLGGTAGRIAMLHALAHIELNAIDLAWDILARFGSGQPRAFLDDWVGVAREEARHFADLERLLNGLGSGYGALPAHAGLWEAATKTAGDLAGRLAVIPMTLEARALDTAPATILRLSDSGESAMAAVMERILEDEISHVAAGVRWFEALCRQTGTDPVARYHAIVGAHFPKGLKAPFNRPARDRAGMAPDYYEPLGQ